MPAKVNEAAGPPPDKRFAPRDLRAIGEAAEAMTGRDLVVVCNAQKKLEVKERSDAKPDTVIVRLYTEPDVADRPKPNSVLFTPSKGSAAQEIVETLDAVFWSEAAFKKFLLSYYHSMRLLTPQAMATLQRAYANPHVIAFGHDPKSVPTVHRDADAILENLHAFTIKGPTSASGGEWLKVTDPQVSA
jgi:hypothetical protein